MVKRIPLESGDVVVCNWNTVGHMAGWIDTLFKSSSKLKKCGLVSALVVSPDSKIFIHGSYLIPKIHVPAPFALGEMYFGQYGGTREVEVSHFICGIVKKDLLEKLPLPDDFGENPFVDADYCLEAAKLGFKTYATTDLTVQYKGPADEKDGEAGYVSRFREAHDKFSKKWGKIIDSRFKLPVLYQACASAPSGFSQVCRSYMRGLTQNGVRVCYNYLKGENQEEPETYDEMINTLMEDHGDLKMPQVVWAQAPYFNKNSGVYKIGHCEFEGESVPSDWIRECNQMDEIWVPTEWDRKKFRNCGVNVPIYIIGQAIDPNYFNPDMAPAQFKIRETFKFLCVSAWDPRKNIPGLIKAFKSEFGREEDVCLIVKTINLGLVKDIKKELKKIKSPKDSGQVYVKEEDYPKEQIPCVYRACDAFVLPTRGEAWGLPLFEALACGLPVITTGYGAPNEILRDKAGEPLPGVHFINYQKTVTDTPYIHLKNNFWAEPSIPDLMKKMRYVYENHLIEKTKALATGKIIRSKFSDRSISYQIKQRLEDIYKNKLK